MYSFEGQFRSKPTQSLGGASKNEHRHSLISRAACERQKREDLRIQNISASKIQSFSRSCLTRKKLIEDLRKQYDSLWSLIDKKVAVEDENVLNKLMKMLIIFFDEKYDNNRLISFCKLLVKRQTLVARLIISSNDIWKYRIKRILILNLNLLINNFNSYPIATSMRMFELFTNNRTYEKFGLSVEINEILLNILSYLLINGYYEKLRKLMELAIPDSLIESPIPPTEMASVIFNLIISPMKFQLANDAKFRCLPLLQMTKAFFSTPFSVQISHFLLPALTASENVDFSNLLAAIYDHENDKMRVESSIWLLFSILKFFKSQKNLNNIHLDFQYLFVLKHICKALPSNLLTSQVDSNIDSDDEEMEIESNTKQDELIKDCVEILNDNNHIEYIFSIVDVNTNNDDCLSSLSSIGYSLLLHCKYAVHKNRLLYTLAFKSNFLRQLWDSVASLHTTSIFGPKTPLLQVLARGFSLNSTESDLLLPQLALFCSLFSYLLVTVNDSELNNSRVGGVVPFPLKELIGMTVTLRDVCLGLIELAYPDTRMALNDEYKQAFRSGSKNRHISSEGSDKDEKFWSFIFQVVVNLLRQLHARDTRKKFCPKDHWLTTRVSLPVDKPTSLHFSGRIRTQHRYTPFRRIQTLTREEIEEGPPLSTSELRTIKVVQELPFVISFTDRVKIFHQLISMEKNEMQGLSGFLAGPMIRINIRRNYLYEDAFDRLSQKNEENLKLKMAVQMKNFAGLDEAGIDGGGIFRDFLSELLKTGFDPNRGIFKSTSDQLLYPNPNSHLILENFNQHFYFLGRMLGKAIYENMLVELPFASFFLSKLLGKQSTSVDIHHLDSLDPILYKNLVSLKKYEGDISNLGIDFTVTNSELGETRVHELKPDGFNIPVTSSNAIEYIHLVSDYKLNKQIQEQCHAFKKGLGNVINLEWLQMFDPRELQVIISGASVPIDLYDLKKNTTYASNYDSTHPVIVKFWNVVENFDQEQLKKFLKFVTSCSHPPLLGFKELHPSFCIQNGGNEDDRLPTASTCMNLLKLPEFKDEETLKEKLIYAIESESGFELS